MNTPVSLSGECKFAFLGLTNARVDIPAAGMIFADGTEVLTKPPIDLDSEWQNWLGIQASQISAANLVLARRAVDGFPPESLPISDDTSWNLAKQVENVFSMLRLLGTIEYESAFLIMGYVQNRRPVCQHFSKFGRYEITRGCLPWLIREEHLATAATLAQKKASLLATFPDARTVRLFRGWWALTTALQHFYASDRIHGFVRALEALIYPAIGSTERQFIHRCSLFAAPSTDKDAARQALEEAYKMRCDVEHLHTWDRSLTKYPISEREDIAYWRTRQMESLACLAYAKVFADNTLQQHFQTDTALEQLWRKPEDEVRAVVSCVCDITKLKVVKNYDSWGRAVFSEWPTGWRESLLRKNGGHAGDTFHALGFTA